MDLDECTKVNKLSFTSSSSIIVVAKQSTSR